MKKTLLAILTVQMTAMPLLANTIDTWGGVTAVLADGTEISGPHDVNDVVNADTFIFNGGPIDVQSFSSKLVIDCGSSTRISATSNANGLNIAGGSDITINEGTFTSTRRLGASIQGGTIRLNGISAITTAGSQTGLNLSGTFYINNEIRKET